MQERRFYPIAFRRISDLYYIPDSILDRILSQLPHHCSCRVFVSFAIIPITGHRATNALIKTSISSKSFESSSNFSISTYCRVHRRVLQFTLAFPRLLPQGDSMIPSAVLCYDLRVVSKRRIMRSSLSDAVITFKSDRVGWLTDVTSRCQLTLGSIYVPLPR